MARAVDFTDSARTQMKTLRDRGAAPTIDDARRAAEALTAAGAVEVWLYGSVARGEARPHSDIDLVAVLHDLDYRRRRRVKTELEQAAEAACGRRVEVLVTDRVEWHIQREHVSASFASAIACDIRLLSCCSSEVGGSDVESVAGGVVAVSELDWDKEQVMATSNAELALERMRGVLMNLTKIDATCTPSDRERDVADEDDPGDYLLVRGVRLVMLCEAADMAVEKAAKAVGVLSEVAAPTLWQHDVQQIVDELDEGDADALGELLAAAPDLVKSPDYVTMWRTRGVYGTPTEGRTAQEIATPAFARSIGLIACDVSAYAAEAVERRIGEQADIADVRRWATRVQEHLAAHDPATGNALT